MAVLSDSGIVYQLEECNLDVSPVDLDEQLQPNSLDIRLSNRFSEFEDRDTPLDPKEGLVEYQDYIDYTVDDYVVLEPGEFVLADTIEDFDMPHGLYGQLHGRSSLGRLGIEVHSTAGLIDAGYTGSITLEIKNVLNRPVKLYTGMRIAQVVFHELNEYCDNPYSDKSNKYQGQSDVVHSRLGEEL